MNFGMIRSRSTSGPWVAMYFPAASAASSAAGKRAFDAASQLVAAAKARIDVEPERRHDRPAPAAVLPGLFLALRHLATPSAPLLRFS
jgi:hypothetical protein